jgi:hypothetical protein
VEKQLKVNCVDKAGSAAVRVGPVLDSPTVSERYSSFGSIAKPMGVSLIGFPIFYIADLPPCDRSRLHSHDL